jgi:hypothetical protein
MMGVRAIFRPQNGSTLKEAALCTGVDHFNWTNLVTYDSYLKYGNPAELWGMRDQYGNLPPKDKPYYDPVPGGYVYQAIRAGRPLPVRDDLIWFLDEEFAGNGIRVAGTALKTMVDQFTADDDNDGQDDTLIFEDKPGTRKGDLVEFTTCLAGVIGGVKGKVFNNSGTCFRWRYEQIAENYGITSIIRDNTDFSLGGDGKVTFLEYVNPGGFTAAEMALFAQYGVEIVQGPPNSNVPPIAAVGPDVTVRVGHRVTLDGTQSVDPDNGPAELKFVWTQSGGPGVNLNGADTATPDFTPTTSGQYMFDLVVTDGKSESLPARVVVTVLIPGDVDGDGDVDKDDINVITKYLNKPASVCPQCDIDGDGKITVLDARKLTLMCTRANCATK